MPGFYMLQPNQAVAITLFGEYRGHRPHHRPALDLAVDGQEKGVGPRQQLHFREDQGQRPARQPDRDGGADRVARGRYRPGIVRRRRLPLFVSVQVEAAIRTIGSRYPYDDFEHQEVTLRGNHDQVGAELRTELQARLAVAGITVDECGFTHLAYAQEIAGAMLRRQQAQAVVAARKTLVEGAVGMVEMALSMLRKRMSSSSMTSAGRRWSRT